MTKKSLFYDIVKAENSQYNTQKGWHTINCPSPSHSDNNASAGIIYNESDDSIKVNCLVASCNWQDAQKALEKKYNFSNLSKATKKEEDLPTPINIDDSILNIDYIDSLLKSYALEEIDFAKAGVKAESRFFPHFKGYDNLSKSKACFAYPYSFVEDDSKIHYKYKSIYRYVKNKKEKYLEVYLPNKLGIGKREQLTTKHIEGFFLHNNIINNNSRLWLVWGEEKALVLAKAGERVVGILNGEGNIKEEEIDYLLKHNNNKINLVSDNDLAGYSASVKITELLLDKGFDVKGLLLKETNKRGYDINDYFVEVGLNRAIKTINDHSLPAKLFITKLNSRIEELTEKKSNEITEVKSFKSKIISYDDLLALDIKPTEWLIEGLLPEGKTLLAATPKVGKTTFALQVAKSLITGKDFFGLKAKKCDVLYLSYDMSIAVTRDYIYNIIGEDGLKNGFHIWNNCDFQFSKKDNPALIKTLKEDLPNVKLIIADTLQHSLGISKINGNAYQRDLDSHKSFVDFCNESGINVMMIHHLAKDISDTSDDFAAISGSNGIRSIYDTNMIIKRIDNIDHKLRIEGRSAYVTDTVDMIKTKSRVWELKKPIEKDY